MQVYFLKKELSSIPKDVLIRDKPYQLYTVSVLLSSNMFSSGGLDDLISVAALTIILLLIIVKTVPYPTIDFATFLTFRPTTLLFFPYLEMLMKSAPRSPLPLSVILLLYGLTNSLIS